MIIKDGNTPAYKAIFNSFNSSLFGRSHTPISKNICGGEGESEEELEEYRSRLKKDPPLDRPNVNNTPDTESAKDSSFPLSLSQHVPTPPPYPTHADNAPGEESSKDSPPPATLDEPKPGEYYSEQEEDHPKPKEDRPKSKKRPATKKKTNAATTDDPTSDNPEATRRSTRGGGMKKRGAKDKNTEETDSNQNVTRQLRKRE